MSIRHGLKGPLGTPVTACAAGVQAIGDAARMIRAGEVDVALCGGAEATIHQVSLAGFAAARALSSDYNDTPHRASRPFDQSRDGFVMGEGAGLLVIEELEHALARGAQPIAEVVGYGTSSDAYHMTAGPEDGNGARRAMELALRQAGIAPSAVQHLNAHATSTPVGDKGELAAIRALFGNGASPAISATKSATGHLLGAAGRIEAIFTILALRDQVAPATLNLENPDDAAEGLTWSAARPGRWPCSMRCPMASALAGSMPAYCSSVGRKAAGLRGAWYEERLVVAMDLQAFGVVAVNLETALHQGCLDAIQRHCITRLQQLLALG